MTTCYRAQSKRHIQRLFLNAYYSRVKSTYASCKFCTKKVLLLTYWMGFYCLILQTFRNIQIWLYTKRHQWLFHPITVRTSARQVPFAELWSTNINNVDPLKSVTNQTSNVWCLSVFSVHLPNRSYQHGLFQGHTSLLSMGKGSLNTALVTKRKPPVYITANWIRFVIMLAFQFRHRETGLPSWTK